jgi:hypothetical protein
MVVCPFALNSAHAPMITDYEISLGTPNDIPEILTLQELNLIERGGGLSVRQTADWFRHAILEKSLVVGHRNGKVAGYVLGTSLAAKAHVVMVQAMLRAFPAPPIATCMAPFAWPKLSAEKVSQARCSKNCKRTWVAAPP